MFWLAQTFHGALSREEMQRYEQWARRERAATASRLAGRLGRDLARAARAATAALGAAWQRRRTVRALNGLDDRMLADIGLTRGDVQMLNRGVWPTRLSEQAAARRRAPLAAVPTPRAADQPARLEAAEDPAPRQRAA